MNIAGKYNNNLVVRCCSEGRWYEMSCGNGSGMIHCNHTGYHCFFDYVDMSKQEEVTDKNIISQLNRSKNIMLRPMKLHQLKRKIKNEN